MNEFAIKDYNLQITKTDDKYKFLKKFRVKGILQMFIKHNTQFT